MLTGKEFNMFLADREESGLVVRLYRLGASYGEGFYDAHTNKILRLKAFGRISQLAPYLAHKFNLH